MLSLIGGLNDYGTWTGSLFSANVSHRWLDYPTAVSYVKARIEPGDAVIAAGTPNLVGNSLGHAPNYWIPPHRTETLLYVFEKNGQAVDTQYGIPTIFNATDFQNALEDHQRVWLIGPDLGDPADAARNANPGPVLDLKRVAGAQREKDRIGREWSEKQDERLDDGAAHDAISFSYRFRRIPAVAPQIYRPSCGIA